MEETFLGGVTLLEQFSRSWLVRWRELSPLVWKRPSNNFTAIKKNRFLRSCLFLVMIVSIQPKGKRSCMRWTFSESIWLQCLRKPSARFHHFSLKLNLLLCSPAKLRHEAKSQNISPPKLQKLSLTNTKNVAVIFTPFPSFRTTFPTWERCTRSGGRWWKWNMSERDAINQVLDNFLTIILATISGIVLTKIHFPPSPTSLFLTVEDTIFL